MARYKINSADVPFAREFLAKPFGYKSPGLQRVLNVMRGQGPAGKYVLICKVPFRKWVLGTLPAKRGEPVQEYPDTVFEDLESAERAVFMRRWRDLGGPDLDILGPGYPEA